VAAVSAVADRVAADSATDRLVVILIEN
jgi:hypothetical protein